MVAPLLLAPLMMAGVAAGGAGRTMLADYLANREREQQAQGFRQALAGSTAEAPRPEGMVGPMPAELDPMALAQQLMAQGDPRGLQLLQQVQGQQAAMGLQQQQQGFTAEQNALNRQNRMDIAGMNQPQPLPTINIPGVGDVPYNPILPGAGPEGKQWDELQVESRDLGRLGQIWQEFSRSVQEGGTEAFNTRLAGLRNEAVDILARQSGAGALQQADIDFYSEAIGDPTAWSPEWLQRNRGRLSALRDRINNAIQSHNMRARFAYGLGQLAPLQSSTERAAAALPEGARYLSDAELDAAVAAQARQSAPIEQGMGLDMEAREAMRRELEQRGGG